MMRFEAVIAEMQGKQVGRTAESCICPAPVARGNQHAALGWRVLVDLLEFPGLNQWNVGGNHDCAFLTSLHAYLRGLFNGGGFAGIVGIKNYLEAIFLC